MAAHADLGEATLRPIVDFVEQVEVSKMSVLASWLRATIEADKAAALVTAQDPRDTIARCEAELAILDEHGIVQVNGIGEDTRVTQIPACRTCSTKRGVPCRTLRLLASGYRHRDGYDDDWSPD